MSILLYFSGTQILLEHTFSKLKQYDMKCFYIFLSLIFTNEKASCKEKSE